MKPINISEVCAWQVEAEKTHPALCFNLTLQPSGPCFLSLIGTKSFPAKANIRPDRRFPLEFVIRQAQVALSKSRGKKFKAHKQWLNPSLCWVSSACRLSLSVHRKFTACWLPTPFKRELIYCPQEVLSICCNNVLKNYLSRKNNLKKKAF